MQSTDKQLTGVFKSVEAAVHYVDTVILPKKKRLLRVKTPVFGCLFQWGVTKLNSWPKVPNPHGIGVVIMEREL